MGLRFPHCPDGQGTRSQTSARGIQDPAAIVTIYPGKRRTQYVARTHCTLGTRDVENIGIEPMNPACKAGVLPLALIPQK